MVAGKPQNGECTHAQLSRFQVGSRWNVTHVPSHTRPSCYSACNIEKLGVAWEQGYTKLVFLRNGLMYEQETQTSDGLVNALSTELWMKLNSWVRGLHFWFLPCAHAQGIKVISFVCLSVCKKVHGSSPFSNFYSKHHITGSLKRVFYQLTCMCT